ncbi:DUF2087 domain-containing protein [Eubacteriales bacterium OttesenSCG-928-M02]|nr:DUF2087 domain-containing protein [Eubacteriales bacterium OttesenSCG-928-M02]
MIGDGIKQFFDEEGRIKAWPARQAVQDEVLAYLSTKFEMEKDYTEREVNEIIQSWHTFGDLFLLRRGMVDFGHLCRTRDGSRYWREAKEENGNAVE